MPFEANRRMTWGPGKDPVLLMPGDEVPEPVKRILVQNGYVLQVDEVTGKKWCDQPEEYQRRWAESEGKSFLTVQTKPEKGEEKPEPVVVEAKQHPTRLIKDGESAQYIPPSRGRQLTSERRARAQGQATDTARQEPVEVAGNEAQVGESAPPEATENSYQPMDLGSRSKRGKGHRK